MKDLQYKVSMAVGIYLVCTHNKYIHDKLYDENDRLKIYKNFRDLYKK